VARYTWLEADVDGVCYTIDLMHHDTLCAVDASAACCPFLPLWHEAAVAGTLHRTDDPSKFDFWSKGRVCRLGPDGKPPRKAPKPAESDQVNK
jgi:hypothetical protein